MSLRDGLPTGALCIRVTFSGWLVGSDSSVRPGSERRRRATQIGSVRVEHSDRNFLADLNRSLSVVERDYARLCLQVGEANFLQRVEEARELELAERCREDDAERRVDDSRIGVRDRR